MCLYTNKITCKMVDKSDNKQFSQHQNHDMQKKKNAAPQIKIKYLWLYLSED